MSEARNIKDEQNLWAAHAHCFRHLPYNMIIFCRLSQQGKPLYYIANLEGGPYSAENALKKAHAKHGGKCHYCEKPVPADSLSIDHVEPKILGGKSHLQNLVVACKPCNAAKRHMVVEAYHPNAGKKWLMAMQKTIEERLKSL